MAEQIEGNPNNWPTDFTIPDDSAPPTSAAHNVAHEALADRTAWLKANVTVIQEYDFPIVGFPDGLIPAPPGATHAILEGYGGGGGGGSGSNSGTTSKMGAGGGGGGGAVKRTVVVPVVAGETYKAEVGAGGAGAVAGGFFGSPGGDTKFSRVSGPLTLLATFRGADGGQRGHSADGFVSYGGTTVDLYTVGLAGGPARRRVNNAMSVGPNAEQHAYRSMVPQSGGYGICARSNHINQHHAGNSSPEGYLGGTGGQNGGNEGVSLWGGGAGGGGGAGPGGDGGNGGNGSNAVPSGSSANGGAGENAAANSGAGGGGGGGAGGAPVGGGLGGAGGNGGSGRLRVIFICRQGVE